MDVAAVAYVAVEAEIGLPRVPVINPYDRLDLLVIRRDASAHESERGRQLVEHVDLDVQPRFLEQPLDDVEARRPRTYDGYSKGIVVGPWVGHEGLRESMRSSGPVGRSVPVFILRDSPRGCQFSARAVRKGAEARSVLMPPRFPCYCFHNRFAGFHPSERGLARLRHTPEIPSSCGRSWGARGRRPARTAIGERVHAYHLVGSAWSGQGNAGGVHRHGLRHTADFHGRHAPGGGQGWHDAGAAREGGDGVGRAGVR